MSSRGRLCCVVILSTALLSSVTGPSLAQPTRPRLGLALGGGSARGFAHIGVLRWLHEHRVPVDVIGGTSMGGLVAGMFATGMSTEDIEALVDDLDWARTLAPDSPFTDKTFRRKEDARAFPSILAFGLRGGPHLPTGLSPAVQVSLLFDRVALPYHAMTSFDDLPTPFRCVAADLRSSEVVVFDSGPLQEALRATMAIPGVFTPVAVGERVLVDGGVLNNVPADIVAGMGADAVIAVDVSADLSVTKTSDSIFAVLGETLDVMMRAGTRRALESATVVIAPDLKDLAGSDFSRVAEFVERGYAAAEANRTVLLRYAVDEAAYQAYLEERRSRRRAAVPAPAFLVVEGVTPTLSTVIRRALQPHVGKPLDAARLERDLVLLTGSERFEALTYRLTTRNGETGLAVTGRGQDHAPPYLLGALDLQNAESSGVVATLRGRLVYLDFLAPDSELRADIGIGSTMRAGAEYYLRLGPSPLFVSPLAAYERSSSNVYVDDALVSEYRRIDREAGADIGLTSGRRFEMRAGYRWQHQSSEVAIGDPLLPVIDGSQRYWRVGAVFDGQDSPVMPSRGLRIDGEVRRYTRTAPAQQSGAVVVRDPDDLAQAELAASYFFRTWRRGRVYASVRTGSSFGDTATVNSLTLGGPFRMGAFNNDELRGSHYAMASAGYFHELARIFEGALGRVYLGGWVESGNAFEEWRGIRFETNVSAGLIIETPLGPGFLTASLGEGGRHRFYVGIGPLFDK